MTRHLIRVAASPEQRIVEVDLPDGEPFDWAEPTTLNTAFTPLLIGEVEYVRDGVVVARGILPNLQPV
jgi:hypothetical protein